MAIGPHWPDPAKKIIQFPHRPRAHTPLGEAVSPTVHLGALTQNPRRAKFTDEPAMRRHPSALQVVLGFATAAMIVAAVTRALYIAQKHQTVAAARDEQRILAIAAPLDNETGFVRDLPPPPRKEQDRF